MTADSAGVAFRSVRLRPPAGGRAVEITRGFSWACFVFGPFWFLAKGMHRWAFWYFAAFVLAELLSLLPSALLAVGLEEGVGAALASLAVQAAVFVLLMAYVAFKANGLYESHLVRRGYVREDLSGEGAGPGSAEL
jgi:hypothetical protein